MTASGDHEIPYKSYVHPETAMTPEEIISQRGWQITEGEDNQKWINVRGQQLRYYSFPPQKYNIDVRLMILKNISAELELILDPDTNSGGNISLPELRKKHAVLHEYLEKNKSLPDSEFKALCCALSHLSFKIGCSLLKDYLTRIKEGETPENLAAQLNEVRYFVPHGQYYAQSGEMKVMGQVMDRLKGEKIFFRLSGNLMELTHIDHPIGTLVADWYQKTAQVSAELQRRANHLNVIAEPYDEKDRLAQLIERLENQSMDLLQARRDEPEYDFALAKSAATLAEIDQCCDAFKGMDKTIRSLSRNKSEKQDFLSSKTRKLDEISHEAHTIFRIAKTREPLAALTQKKRSTRKSSTESSPDMSC